MARQTHGEVNGKLFGTRVASTKLTHSSNGFSNIVRGTKKSYTRVIETYSDLLRCPSPASQCLLLRRQRVNSTYKAVALYMKEPPKPNNQGIQQDPCSNK